MKNFIFANTNNSIAFSCYKALVNLLDFETEFNIIFDRYYDIFELDSRLSKKFHIVTDRHISENILYNQENILLDFDLDFFLSNFTSYDDYISSKISSEICMLSEPLQINPSTDTKIKVDEIISNADLHNFSYVLFAPLNMDLDKNDFIKNNNTLIDKTSSSFPIEISEQLHSFLESKVNLITITPSSDFNVDIAELVYLISQCDFVISNLDILHSVSIDQRIPSFLNLAKNTKYYQKDRLCTVYDPQRNHKRITPPAVFSQSRRQADIHNNQIITWDPEKIKKEIIKSFDFHGVPYKS